MYQSTVVHRVGLKVLCNPSMPAQVGLKEMMLSLISQPLPLTFYLTELLNMTFISPHVHHSKEHSKPLAWPVETGCPRCLDIWPL